MLSGLQLNASCWVRHPSPGNAQTRSGPTPVDHRLTEALTNTFCLRLRRHSFGTRSAEPTQNCVKVTQTVSETVGICVFSGFVKKPCFGLIQSKTSGNPYLAGVLLDAQAGDSASNHQLLNL